MRPKSVSRGVGTGQTAPIHRYICDISYMSHPLPLNVLFSLGYSTSSKRGKKFSHLVVNQPREFALHNN